MWFNRWWRERQKQKNKLHLIRNTERIRHSVLRSRVLLVIQWMVIVTLRHPYKMTAMFLRSDHIICMQYYLLCVELDNNRWNSQPSPFHHPVLCLLQQHAQQWNASSFCVRFEGDIVIHKVLRLLPHCFCERIAFLLTLTSNRIFQFVQYISNCSLRDTHLKAQRIPLSIFMNWITFFFLFLSMKSISLLSEIWKKDFRN